MSISILGTKAYEALLRIKKERAALKQPEFRVRKINASRLFFAIKEWNDNKGEFSAFKNDLSDCVKDVELFLKSKSSANEPTFKTAVEHAMLNIREALKFHQLSRFALSNEGQQEHLSMSRQLWRLADEFLLVAALYK